MNTYAIILAGGNGERLWPLSTPERPKQFVSLFGGKSLIRHAVDRLEGLVPPERIIVITAARLAAMTRRALPCIPKENIIGEPCRRDTAAAVALACGLVKKYGGEKSVGCILTADQLMTPEDEFRKTLKDAVKVARKSASIVTMGIAPDGPATGFGYIECGEDVDFGTGTGFCRVKRFVEKPDVKTARKYLRSGRFRWNGHLAGGCVGRGIRQNGAGYRRDDREGGRREIRAGAFEKGISFNTGDFVRLRRNGKGRRHSCG